MEALREPCYPSITDVPFGIVRYMNQSSTRETYDLSYNHVTIFETSGGAIIERLTKNDKRSEREMSTETRM